MENQLFQHYCTKCGSTALTLKPESQKSHYLGWLICDNCNWMVERLPRPPKHQAIIDTALATGKIKSWEELFLKSIRDKRYLTIKQESKLQKILLARGIDIEVDALDSS